MDGMSTRERAVIDEQIDVGTAALVLISRTVGQRADWRAFLAEFTRQMFRDLEKLREDEAWDMHEARKTNDPNDWV